MPSYEKILIIDFGSQYTQIIARRIRESKVFSIVKPYTISLNEVKSLNPTGIILSGGPQSVCSKEAYTIDKNILKFGIPILGICYGLQLLCKILKGEVKPAENREYGKSIFKISEPNKLFKGVKKSSSVWMSHGDLITKPPKGFISLGSSDFSPFCAIANLKDEIYGVQFHPEVNHTEEGEKIIKNFLYNICNCKGDWQSSNFIETSITQIKNRVGSSKAICALSGGVDSTVAAVLMKKAIGENLICIHIDTGLMRKDESNQIEKMFTKELHLNAMHINAKQLFLKRLFGISDPEEKRQIIGKAFIYLFEKESKKYSNLKFLVQGTLYPDVIESSPMPGTSVTIKTHHNVGGLPEKMNLKLIEPFRDLFKDEVRNIGKELNIPDTFLERHPFPGPGLAVRIIGEITEDRLNIIKEADDIFILEIKKKNLYNKIWQAFVVLLPIQTVGVMGDKRTYENVLALRAITSNDGMTADWFRFDPEFLAEISNKIINNVRGVNRVVYDISSKPPATIEWE
ncbi:MAG: glutamine-hydrolyzing GMP synthase [Ignavibacteriales bacterium CG_4_9_14_3_um_filter_30_11]|nr:MAG: glutamine-hydrolyzing GMP synthase [Ignavibacteriales bacterium CG_4_9_14_3_um_filter_30_11]